MNNLLLEVEGGIALLTISIVIACVDGEFTVKYLHRHPQAGGSSLVPANPRYAPILLDGRQEVELFGVVTATIHRFSAPPHR